jgi:hypothetical protein
VPESKDKLSDAFPEWVVTPNLDTLTRALTSQTTMTELFKLANDDDFKAAVATLSDANVKALRASYNDMRTRLDGKVKLETYDGQVVNLVGIDWWHSDSYDNDGVSLHLRSEREPDKKVKCMTSSAPVVTFCNRLRDLPSEQKPLRIVMSLVPVRDPERAAKGQKIWQVKQMPPARGQTDSNVPF